ncbi:hypothetical protein Tco_1175929 [Tanacetum coccineum]
MLWMIALVATADGLKIGIQVHADVQILYAKEFWASAYIENKNTKKGNAMYYPRFTKLVVNFVMDKDPSIPRRNKVGGPNFNNEDIRRNWNIHKSSMLLRQEQFLRKNKGSKKKAYNHDTITKQKPPMHKEIRSLEKENQKTTELKSSDDDQDDEKAQDDQDDEKAHDDEDDDVHDDDENVQDDDNEEQTESEDDVDDFVHSKIIISC